MNDKIKTYVIPNIPYVLLFWFFCKLGEAYRLSPGDDTIRKIMNSIGSINTAFAHPMPSFVPQDLFFGLIGAAAVFLIVLIRKKNKKNWRKDVEYGSARWRA